MKRIIIAAIAVMLLLVQNVTGQKAEKLYFEAYFKNQPKYYLPEAPYTVKYVVSDWFKEKIKEKEANLELKGYTEGEGYKVFFISEDPELKLDAQRNSTANAAEVRYKGVVEVKANNRIMITNNNNELVYEFSIKPKLFHGKDVSMEESKTEDGAIKIARSTSARKGDYMKNMYVEEIFKAYQDTLDILFGQFTRKEEFKLFTLNPKKFNYDDFNGAAEKIKSACLTENTNIEELNASISTLESLKLEHKPGKKTRISDVNFDHLYLNLAQAYLVKGDFEKARENYEKALAHKGNRTIESHIGSYLKPQIENSVNYPKSKMNYAPKELTSVIKRQNRSLFFNLILGSYITNLNEDRNIVIEYFPMNISFVDNIEVFNNSDYYDEKYTIKYNQYCDPIKFNYQLFEEDSLIKRRNFSFKYDDNRLVEAGLSGLLKFKISYDGDRISEVFYQHNKSKSNTFIMDYNSDPEKVIIKLKYTQDGVTKDSNRKYYIKFNEYGAVDKYFIDIYSSGFLYDDANNWVGIKGVNHSTGDEYENRFEVEYDKYGICTKRKYGEDDILVREINYME